MSGYNLRRSWASAPFAPTNELGYELEKRTFLLPDARGTAEFTFSHRRMRPLKYGLRASSPAGTLVTSLRTALSSFEWPPTSPEWPSGYSPAERIWFGSGAAPHADDERAKDGVTDPETQGVAFSDSLMFLVCTDTIWAVSLASTAAKIADPAMSTPTDLDRAIGAATDRLLRFDSEGATFVGRFQIQQDKKVGPVHLSAPFVYQDRLFVPAEGNPYGPGDERSLPPAEDREGWDSAMEFQWIYVYDTRNLGYVGRIGLPARLPTEEVALNSHITACAFDPICQRIYAVRYGDDRPVNEIYVFQMPDLRRLAPVGSTLQTEDVVRAYPTLAATFVAYLPLSDQDGPVDLVGVNGVAVSPSGRIFVDYQASGGVPAPFSTWDPKRERRPIGKDFGMAGIDPVTGRVVRYVSLDLIDKFGTFHVPQGITVHDSKLYVLVWKPATFRALSEFELQTFVAAAGGEP